MLSGFPSQGLSLSNLCQPRQFPEGAICSSCFTMLYFTVSSICLAFSCLGTRFSLVPGSPHRLFTHGTPSFSSILSSRVASQPPSSDHKPLLPILTAPGILPSDSYACICTISWVSAFPKRSSVPQQQSLAWNQKTNKWEKPVWFILILWFGRNLQAGF